MCPNGGCDGLCPFFLSDHINEPFRMPIVSSSTKVQPDLITGVMCVCVCLGVGRRAFQLGVEPAGSEHDQRILSGESVSVFSMSL